ncbi:enoyl-CoA hydratase/isomerase family protein [Phaeobacter gallaeciensis]|jgi:enoyl-CoA hydratase/carnithine racemase|uniref:Enoyl-CoA hydratase/isomerase family protein n=1 Tax=Phaeobacter gallaeciensis TaxID=60890 RepID=A0ABD4XEE9_9RHOB|nr:enoyl-CoA hydratase/isomerase family protein [Phaeobacter gallaeciensis]MDE4142238.1 enoyl-CoA hydratase/isomerase family protein [Phaeobacter gallaeciensis]MDE4146566.1 enoyl-CoA hydratase/isomerase family protein [Phaeobacter gallaeciensis]MDE4150639.1 enoyl-CoA hydratase/isomerase family protein [Phaeobacter gallaeciensis]MDE4154818.1 enoyl-CoA hydratase/isomerase family protein [Phaeobacter gallaeciensis]MDE4159292.1 enoyl-CoA hydratase/isomerase family protein [Phaeobacter gallaeciensi
MTQTQIQEKSSALTRICRVEAGTAWITMDRPDKANAVSTALLTDILEALDAAEKTPGVNAVVFTGEGRHFCAGADLSEFLAEGASAFRRLLNSFREVCIRFEASPLPIIAMVQGAARAGGLELMLCCDAVVAEEGATLGDAHMLRNLLPGGGNSVRLPRTIGHQRAKWMILTGQSISASQAQDWGIVTDCVPLGSLRDETLRVVADLTIGHRATIARAKSLLVASDKLGFEEALENEIVQLEQHSASPVLKESLSGFLHG